MDLCDTSSLKQFNDGDTFILSIIDVFSKIGFARLLKDKKGPTVLKAFLNVLEESGRKPIKVQTDAGLEFTNRTFKSTLKKQNIHFYVTFSENKAAVVERFNRTLKSRMWRYFTHNNTYRYVDVLQELVSGYNAFTLGCTQQTQDVSKTFYNGFEMVLYLKYVFQRSLKRCNKTFLAKRFINVLKIGFEDVFMF